MIYANIVERVKELNNDAWLSLVERCVRDAEVAGSNPVAPSYLLTNKSMSVTNNNLSQFFIKIKCILFFHEALLLLHCHLPDCTHCLDFPAGLVLRK